MLSREEKFKELEKGSTLLKPGVVAFQLTKLQLEESDKQFNWLVRLNIVVIIISLIALVATTVFSALDYYGDLKWQRHQLEELQNIKSILEYEKNFNETSS